LTHPVSTASASPLVQRLRAVLRTAYRAATVPADTWAIRALARAPHPDAARMAAALRAVRRPLSGPARAAVDAIERERAQLVDRGDPLMVGGLGEPMPFDVTSTVGEACGVSKSPAAARLLYQLVAAFRPRSVLELGTNVGISSAYLSAALRANGDGGRLTTLDASPYRLRMAREVHGRLGIDNIDYVQGLFENVLEQALRGMAPVDLAFIDGHHQYAPTLAYTDVIWKHARPGALFVFDDIRWSQGMRKAWAALQADERFALTVDVGLMGLAAGRTDGVGSRYRSRRMYSVAR
jgi:predicted O-methyltransferase YrrM